VADDRPHGLRNEQVGQREHDVVDFDEVEVVDRRHRLREFVVADRLHRVGALGSVGTSARRSPPPGAPRRMEGLRRGQGHERGSTAPPLPTTSTTLRDTGEVGDGRVATAS